jgi:hypothetical protein
MYRYASAGHPSQSEVFNGCGSIRQYLGHRLSLLRTFFKNIADRFAAKDTDVPGTELEEVVNSLREISSIK